MTVPNPQVMIFLGSARLAPLLPSPGLLLALAIPNPFHLASNGSALKADCDANASSRILDNCPKQLPCSIPQECKYSLKKIKDW